jgi:hypothetical protein
MPYSFRTTFYELMVVWDGGTAAYKKPGEGLVIVDSLAFLRAVLEHPWLLK